MCNCFDEMKEKVIERVKKDLPKHTGFESDWQNRSLFFGENPPKISTTIPFEFSYRRIKVSGEPYKNKITETKSAVMSYCPFCGKKAE